MLPQLPLHMLAKGTKKEGEHRLLKSIGAIEIQSKLSFFNRNPHPSRPIFGAERQRHIEYYGMNMQVQVAVDMRERKTGCTKSIELRCELLFQFTARPAGKIVLETR